MSGARDKLSTTVTIDHERSDGTLLERERAVNQKQRQGRICPEYRVNVLPTESIEVEESAILIERSARILIRQEYGWQRVSNATAVTCSFDFGRLKASE